MNADSLSTWFLPALATVNERFRVQFRLHRDDQERTALLLEAGTVMAAVTADPSAVSGCSVEYIGTMQYTAHASRSFVRRWFPDGATADEFQRAPIVDFDAHDVLQTRFLAQQGVERTAPHHIISASGEFCRAISLGLGWGMLLPSQLLTLDDALVQLPGAPITTPLYWQQWNLSSTLLDAVRESVFAAAHSAIDVV
ncbi:ArgP/LysG family DNA-binding transcriptional regulator [Humidisolicoccus flavus]|uniref:ArgP/LysG family DNA-binding transcriptional regulator n=1 Tax=Humidisolicoccus flavus TaxID=3111414 RepID=UPI0032565A7A